MRQVTAFLCIVAVALIGAATTSAKAEQIRIALDDHFQSEFLSDECGFDVFIDFVGDLKVTLLRNKSGLVVRETDRVGGGRQTFRSPDTGKSFSFPIQPSHWDYGSGAVVGSPVIVSFTGLKGHIPGVISSDAGLLRFLNVVEGFDDFGIAQVEFVEVIDDRGHRNSQEETIAAICSTLSAS
jgi:hypothetical protein